GEVGAQVYQVKIEDLNDDRVDKDCQEYYWPTLDDNNSNPEDNISIITKSSKIISEFQPHYSDKISVQIQDLEYQYIERFDEYFMVVKSIAHPYNTTAK
ncbi:19828_t:CDS:2, partial [Racocetra persica]